MAENNDNYVLGWAQLKTFWTKIKTLVSGKANDSEVVKLSGNQTVAGEKKFTGDVVKTNLRLQSTTESNTNRGKLRVYKSGEADDCLQLEMIQPTNSSGGSHRIVLNKCESGTWASLAEINPNSLTKDSITSTSAIVPTGKAVYSYIAGLGLASSSALSDEVTRAKAAEKTNADAIATLTTTVSGKADSSKVYTKTEIDSKVTTINTAINGKAADNSVVHLAGTETITGTKTFSGGTIKTLGGSLVGTSNTTDDRSRVVAGDYSNNCFQVNVIQPKSGDPSVAFSQCKSGTWTDFATITKDSNTTTPISSKTNTLVTGKAVEAFVSGKGYITGVADGTITEAKLGTTLANKINGKANSSDVVKLTGDQTVAGIKTFTNSPKIGGTDYESAKASNITTTGTYLTSGKAVYDFVTGQGYAADSGVVHKANAETISGAKTFSSTPVLSATTLAGALKANIKSDGTYLVAGKAVYDYVADKVTAINTSISTVSGNLTTEIARAKAEEAKKANSADVYTKSAADTLLAAKATTSALNSEVSTRKSEITRVEGVITSTAATTLADAKKYADTVSSGAMIWKGTCTYAKLPTTGQRVGDFWTVSDKQNKEFAWDGKGWMDIGADVDFSAIQTSIDNEVTRAKAAESTLQTNINAKANSADVYTKTQANSTFQAKGSYLTGVPDNSVTTAKIYAGAVTTAKIADANVTEAKLDTTLAGKINGKANSSDVVKLTGDQTVGGVKTFSNSPKLSTTTGLNSADKAYITSTSTTLMAGKAIYDYIDGKGFATTSALSSKADTSALNSEITRAKAAEEANTTAITNLTTTVNGKATDSAVIHKAGAEEFTGTKTFTNLDLKSGGGLAKTTGWGSKTNITNGLEISAGTQHNTTATSNGKARFTMLGRGSTDAEKSIFAFEHTTNNSSGVTQWNRYGVITDKSKSKDSITSTSETFPNGKAVYDYVAGQVSTLNTSIGNKANSADVYTKTVADGRFQAKGTYLTGIADGSITTAKIKDANVTEDKLDSTLATKINGKVNSNAAIPRRTDKTDFTRVGCTNLTAYDDSTDNPANASSTIANSSWYFITGKAAKAYMDANYTKTSGVVTLANSQTITGTKKFDGGIDLYSESNFRNLSTWNGQSVRGYSTTIKPASGDTGTSQGKVYHALYQTSQTDAEFYIDHGINVKQSDGTYKFTRYGIIDKNSNSSEAINQSFEDLVTGKAVKTYLTGNYNTKSNTVNTTGDQSIAGTKTFTSTVNIGATSGNYVQADTNRYGRYASSGSYLNGYYMGSNFLDLEYNGGSSYLRVSADSKTASTAIKSGSALVPSGGAVYSYINSWQANTSNIKDNAITTAKMALGNSTWYPVWGTANTRTQLLPNMNYNMVLVPSGFGLIKPSSAAGGDCIIVNNGTSVAVPVYNASTGSGIWFTIPGKCTAIMHYIAEWGYTIKPDICTPVGVKITNISALQATWYSLNSSNYIYTTTTSPAGHIIYLPPYGVEGDIVEVFGVFETEVPMIQLFINIDPADSSTVVKKITAWQNVKGLDLKALWVNGKWNIIRRDVSVSQTDIEEVAPGPNILYLKTSDIRKNYVFNVKDCLFQAGYGISMSSDWLSPSGTKYLIALDKEYDMIVYEGEDAKNEVGFGNSTYTNPRLGGINVLMIVPMGSLLSNGNANGPTNTAGKIKKFSNGYTVKLIGIKIDSESFKPYKYILHSGSEVTRDCNRFREFVHWREYWFDPHGY